MIEVGVHRARTQLSRLLERVMGGEEVLITRRGKPVARLVPVQSPRRRLMEGDADVVDLTENLDVALPPDVLSDAEW